jgi:hypothetical protein
MISGSILVDGIINNNKMTTERMENYLGNHPYIGFAFSGLHVLGAICLQVVQSDVSIPLYVMQLFQIGAWTAAMLAGVFTCYGVYKTHHGKKNKKVK